MLGITLSFGLLASACGGSSAHNDGGAADLSAASDLPPKSIACVTASDCPASEPLCFYAIADGCSAKGSCGLSQTNPGVAVELCGCNGQPVMTYTAYYGGGGGYAFAPVSSGSPYAESACATDGGFGSDAGH